MSRINKNMNSFIITGGTFIVSLVFVLFIFLQNSGCVTGL